MSTKGTIGYKKPEGGVGYHLYHECFDDSNIYLELNNLSDFDFDFFDKNVTVRIAIPKEVMSLICKDLKEGDLVKSNDSEDDNG